MQSSPRRMNDRQAAIFISVAVGAIVAIVTTATFYWIYGVTLGRDQREAAAAAGVPWDSGQGIRAITDAQPNAPTDGREPWLGLEAWAEGVQAGQAWVEANPNPVNVQVLTGMDSGQVWAYMQQYVSGGMGVGCQYCHDLNNFAADTYEAKINARNMLYLVSDVNSEFIVNLPNWRGNFVQCATCHNNQPVAMEGWGTQFENSIPPISVVVNPLDENGNTVSDPALKPEALREPVFLKDAILYYVYNYQVWRPYDPNDPESGRGSLALTYEGGRDQSQVTINQNVMNYQSWALGVNCMYCHNSRNFVAYETDPAGTLPNPEYAYNKLKTQRMMELTTWLYANWDQYGAVGYESIPEIGASETSYHLINGLYYNVPSCYTCHAGNAIPLASINEANIPSGDAGQIVLPIPLRGGQ